MFKEAITSTPFTSEEADYYFSLISGDYFRDDISFLSTLRALVFPRIKTGESIALRFYDVSRTADEIKTDYNRALGLGACHPGTIAIQNFCNSSPENNHAWMEMVRSKFVNSNPNWHRLDKVTEFFKKSFNVLCFINPDKKSVVVFTELMNLSRMHYLQCAIFAFLPWYFDPKLGVSELEMELIESLRCKDSSGYEDCLARMANQHDFRNTRIRRLLSGFETGYQQAECDTLRQNIQYCIDKITEYNKQIADRLKIKNGFEVTLLGLETKMQSGVEESEIMNYFLHNDKVVLWDVRGSQVSFGVKTYLEYFDEDLAARVIQNPASYVYQPNGKKCNNIIRAEDMEKLMTAIFLNRELRIRFCAGYQLDINGGVAPVTRTDYGPECRRYTPNPHIDRFRCIGNYLRTINELLTKHDYVGAVEQCMASCKSLNFNDSTVMCEFMRRIYGISDTQIRANTKYIELPDGTVVSPVEAIKWLNDKGGAGK